MLLVWSSYTEIDRTTGGEYRGSFDGIDEFGLVRKPPFKDPNDDEEVLLAWHVNMDELERK